MEVPALQATSTGKDSGAWKVTSCRFDGIEPESVFGQMKNNRGIPSLLLRGLLKLSLEVGWLLLAHHLLKKTAIDRKHDKVAKGQHPQRHHFSTIFQPLGCF